jgi:hypothetical protein
VVADTGKVPFEEPAERPAAPPADGAAGEPVRAGSGATAPELGWGVAAPAFPGSAAGRRGIERSSPEPSPATSSAHETMPTPTAATAAMRNARSLRPVGSTKTGSLRPFCCACLAFRAIVAAILLTPI